MSLGLYGYLSNLDFALLMKGFENSSNLHNIRIETSILNPTNVWALRCLLERLYVDSLRTSSSISEKCQQDTWFYFVYFLVNNKVKLPNTFDCPDPSIFARRKRIKFMMKYILNTYCKQQYNSKRRSRRQFYFSRKNNFRKDFGFLRFEQSII